MNKIIPFIKIITLEEPFDEIEKIALDDTLKLEDDYTIKGDLIVRGCLKKAEKEEDFSYPIPVEIAIDEKYDTSKCHINIDDFYYEIINEQDIRVKIDLILDDLYYKEIEIKKEELVLEANREETFKEELDELEEFIIEPKSEKKQEIPNTILKEEAVFNDLENNANDNKSDKFEDLFKETTDNKEYSVYRVYTVSEGETLEYILEKYKVTKEDLMPINDLENIKPGVKLIIPSVDE